MYSALQRVVVPQRVFLSQTVATTFTLLAILAILASVLRFDVYAMIPFVPLVGWFSMVVVMDGAEALPPWAGMIRLPLLQLPGLEQQ